MPVIYVCDSPSPSIYAHLCSKKQKIHGVLKIMFRFHLKWQYDGLKFTVLHYFHFKLSYLPCFFCVFAYLLRPIQYTKQDKFGCQIPHQNVAYRDIRNLFSILIGPDSNWCISATMKMLLFAVWRVAYIYFDP